MKKFYYTICCILVAGLFVFSCTSDDLVRVSPDKTDEQLNMPDQYKEVGEMHNEALDYVFTSIKESYRQTATKSGVLETKLSKENYLKLGEQALKEFCAKKFKNYSTELHEKLMHNVKAAHTKSSVDEMSSGVSDLLHKMNRLLEKAPASPSELLKGLNKINQEAADKLSASDAAAIYVGTSTCYNSYLYWKENYMKWIIALNHPKLLNRYNDQELNQFVLKDGKLRPPVALVATKGSDSEDTTSSWLDDIWDAVSETWDSVDHFVSSWWNEGGGKEVVSADAGSAVTGAIGTAIATGGAGAALGGLGAGAAGSVGAALEEWIKK